MRTLKPSVNFLRIVFVIVLSLCTAAVFAGESNEAAAGQTGDKAWNQFVDLIAKSNTEFAKGAVGRATNAVWSHGDDATLFGGYGGLIEPGWKNVKARLKWAASQAKDGKYSSKLIKSVIKGDSAYILQTEEYVFPGKPVMNILVTMICHREKDGWKIVHRHGNVMKAPEPPVKK